MDKYLRLLSQGGSAGVNINSPEYRHRFYLDWTTKICAL